MALWEDLALYSTTVTRKPLDYLQNMFFGTIARASGLMTYSTKLLTLSVKEVFYPLRSLPLTTVWQTKMISLFHCKKCRLKSSNSHNLKVKIQEKISNLRIKNTEVLYQAWDTAFHHHQMKHWEESWKYDAQWSIFDKLQGVWSGDEALCRMLDITS